jgi:hypothetical protein
VHLLTVVERLARIAERVRQMKERHAAWRDMGTDASLAALAKEAARAAVAAVLKEEGVEDPRLYSPVDSAAAADGSDGEGLYPPVNSGAAVDDEREDLAALVARQIYGDPGDVEGAAADGEGLYSPVNSGAMGEEPPPGAADAAPPSPASGGATIPTAPDSHSSCRAKAGHPVNTHVAASIHTSVFRDGPPSRMMTTDRSLLDAVGTAGERATRLKLHLSGGILHHRRRELLGTIAEIPVQGKARVAAADRALHGTTSRCVEPLHAVGGRPVMQINAR